MVGNSLPGSKITLHGPSPLVLLLEKRKARNVAFRAFCHLWAITTLVKYVAQTKLSPPATHDIGIVNECTVATAEADGGRAVLIIHELNGAVVGKDLPFSPVRVH